MKAELLQRAPDFVVINTDGWVSGDIAIRYKAALVKELKPDVIVAIQRQDELEPLIASLETPSNHELTHPCLSEPTHRRKTQKPPRNDVFKVPQERKNRNVTH